MEISDFPSKDDFPSKEFKIIVIMMLIKLRRMNTVIT